MKPKKYKRLTLSERVIIETLLKEKRTKSYISKKLNRSRSTISREINKWGEDYDAELASWNAKDDYLNKRNLDKINTYFKLNHYVFKRVVTRTNIG